MFPLTVFNAIVESKGEQIIDPTTKANKLAIGSALKCTAVMSGKKLESKMHVKAI